MSGNENQKKKVSGFMLSNGSFILGIEVTDEPLYDPSEGFIVLDTPVQIIAQGNAMGFAELTPFAKDKSRFGLADTHIMGIFIPSHPVSEEYHKYYTKLNSHLELPPEKGLVLPQ